MERAQARADRDFARADALREQIAALGFDVRDVPAGWELDERAPYDVLASVADLPDRSGNAPTRTATVSLLVQGWPDDVRGCLDALLAHLPAGTAVQALDVGNVDGAGDALHAYAGERVEVWHVQEDPGWGAARAALLRADPAEIHVWWELSTLAEGDWLAPLLAVLDDPTVVGTGWQGVNVDLADDWHSFVPAGPGDVDAVLGYLFAMRRDAALRAGGPDPAARYYRNADMEFSFAVREAALRERGTGRLVVPSADAVPVRQARHRGYHDVDAAYRDRESRRTYARFLRRFGGRTDLLAPRQPVPARENRSSGWGDLPMG